jgi:DNA polymerase-3 subunit delta'
VASLTAALDAPVHAYLLLGPAGTGKRAAALSFAAGLLSSPDAGVADPERATRLALAGHHPDLVIVERAGAAISADQADDIVRRASRSATEGRRKVLVLDEFHLVQPAAAAKLLKTIEEPPEGTFFVVLAEEITPELVTIASRCVRIDFRPVPTQVLVDRLISEGVEPDRAADIAGAAHGDLRRARLLATDERLAIRLAAWRAVPQRLDGTGHTAAGLMDQLRGLIDDAAAPLAEQQRLEAEELTERIERYGQRGSGAKTLEERHRREVRRLRTDELRLGLAELARAYRDELAVALHPRPLLAAEAAIQQAAEALLRNPNEELLLLALLTSLPPLSS